MDNRPRACFLRLLIFHRRDFDESYDARDLYIQAPKNFVQSVFNSEFWGYDVETGVFREIGEYIIILGWKKFRK